MQWVRVQAWLLVVGLLLLGGLSIGSCAGVAFTPGERLYRSKCGACHVRYRRTRLDPAGWSRVLEGHQRHFSLTRAERKRLLEWLSAPERGRARN